MSWPRPHAAMAVMALLAIVAACSDTSASSNAGATGASPGTEPTAQPADPPYCASAPQGTVLAREITSRATGGVEHLRIYVPPQFERSARGATPLLVLLHGGTADETQWIDVGIANAADCMIDTGEVQPLMIVTVDGSRVEAQHGGSPPPMEQFITDEVLPYLRARYPSLGGRAATSIGGISRGGGWALGIAADRPDLFSAAGGHSPTADLSDEQLRSLATHQVRLWLDVGHQDRLRPRVQRLAGRVRSAGYGVLVRGWDGGHDRRYWSHHVEDYLRFYGRTL